jgi:hypothetical protein
MPWKTVKLPRDGAKAMRPMIETPEKGEGKKSKTRLRTPIVHIIVFLVIPDFIFAI